MSPVDLHTAYMRTTYWVEARSQPLALRIGENSRGLDLLLGRLGTSRWAFVTAWNPLSQLRSQWYNAQRQRALRRVVERSGWRWLRGLAQSDAGDWPAEPGLLLLGIGAQQARRLGRRFRQYAVVAGERGKPARLLWCEGTEVT